MWAPIVSQTSITKLQSVQNAALRACTGHTKDTNQRHYHEETKILPIQAYMQMTTSIFREGTRDPSHPLHSALHDPEPDRRMKRTAFDTSYVTMVHGCDREGMEAKEREINKKTIHTAAVTNYLAAREAPPLLQRVPPEVHHSEVQLPREKRRQLAQLRAGKCPLLQGYLHHIGKAESPNCKLCTQVAHDTAHMFRCPNIPTRLTPEDLWREPIRAAQLVSQWEAALAALEEEE